MANISYLLHVDDKTCNVWGRERAGVMLENYFIDNASKGMA